MPCAQKLRMSSGCQTALEVGSLKSGLGLPSTNKWILLCPLAIRASLISFLGSFLHLIHPVKLYLFADQCVLPCSRDIQAGFHFWF